MGRIKLGKKNANELFLEIVFAFTLSQALDNAVDSARVIFLSIRRQLYPCLSRLSQGETVNMLNI
jgi:hypothetical protein